MSRRVHFIAHATQRLSTLVAETRQTGFSYLVTAYCTPKQHCSNLPYQFTGIRFKMNTAEKKYRTLSHFVALMKIVKNAMEIQFDQHELDPPAPLALLNRRPKKSFTSKEKNILRAYASPRFR